MTLRAGSPRRTDAAHSLAGAGFAWFGCMNAMLVMALPKCPACFEVLPPPEKMPRTGACPSCGHVLDDAPRGENTAAHTPEAKRRTPSR